MRRRCEEKDERERWEGWVLEEWSGGRVMFSGEGAR